MATSVLNLEDVSGGSGIDTSVMDFVGGVVSLATSATSIAITDGKYIVSIVRAGNTTAAMFYIDNYTIEKTVDNTGGYASCVISGTNVNVARTATGAGYATVMRIG